MTTAVLSRSDPLGRPTDLNDSQRQPHSKPRKREGCRGRELRDLPGVQHGERLA